MRLLLAMSLLFESEINSVPLETGKRHSQTLGLCPKLAQSGCTKSKFLSTFPPGPKQGTQNSSRVMLHHL